MRKYLITLCIAISSLLFINSVKAYEVTYTSEAFGRTDTANISDDLPYYYIFEMNNNIVLFVSSQPIIANYNNKYYFANGQTIYIYRNNTYGNNWNSVAATTTTGQYGFNMTCTTLSTCIGEANKYMKVSNYDVTYYNTNDIVFANNVVREPEISFTTQNYSSNGSVYKVDLTIDYGYIDNDNYIYLYSLDEGNSWVSNHLTDSTSYTLSIERNQNVIARIVDKTTYDPIDTKTITISNIETYSSISFGTETLKDEYNNVYQTNVTINYDTQNRNLYDYQYTTDNYVLEGQQLWVSLDSDKSSIVVESRQNINVIARIVDIDSGAIIKTSTYTITQNNDKPKISFKAFENLKYLGGADVLNDAQTVVESVDLTIDFALVDNDKYAYMYKTIDNDNEDSGWTTVYLLNRSIDLNFTRNTNVVAQVYDKVNNKILTNATFSITTIYNQSNIETTQNFINQMSDIMSQFMGLFDYLFKGLHPIIRTFIISIFTILIICTIIKLLRRK